MIKERAMELVAALRSGDYKQGKNLLKRVFDDGEVWWCCLGVACDLKVKADRQSPGVVGVALTESNTFDYTQGRTYRKGQFDGRDGLLPQSVKAYFGFQSDNGALQAKARPLRAVVDDGWSGPEEREFLSLADANDGRVTFTQIADYIEANWDNL